MKSFTKQQLNTKKWSKYFIYTTAIITISIVLLNYIIDPYQIYRKATLYTFKIQDQRYLNAGLAKNYNYDSMIVGSSMTENFYNDDVKKILGFNDVIKLPFQGSSIFEEVALMKTAFRYKKIKNIIFGFDIYSFSGETTPLSKSTFFPSYLYDENIFNDSIYLLNFKVLRKSIKSLKNPYNANQVQTQLNSIYNWQKIWQSSFNVKNVLNLYHQEIKNFRNYDKDKKTKYITNFSFKILKQHFDTQLLEIIKKHPKTNFYIFYPPYSILAYKIMYQQKILKDTIKFKQYIFNTLKQYRNVKIYDFQVADEVVENLHNYKDTNHYNETINKWILKQISKDNYLVRDDNIQDYSKHLFDIAKNYKVPTDAF